MIILFHGSNIDVPRPLVKVGREKVDFGQGFYLTNLRKQAESWAEVIAERKGRNTNPVLSLYAFDNDSIKVAGYKIKVFEAYNREWLDYVVDCRKGGEMQHQYDMVEGGVANDNVIDTVEDYENGIITAEQAVSLRHCLNFERQHSEIVHHQWHACRHHAEVFGTHQHPRSLSQHWQFLHRLCIPEIIVSTVEIVIAQSVKCFLLMLQK